MPPPLRMRSAKKMPTRIAETSAPARKPISLRTKRSSSDATATATTNVATPAIQATAFCRYAFSAMSACASVRARMKIVAASVNKNMSRLPSVPLVGEELLTDLGADERRDDVPRRTTTSRPRRAGSMPERKSSCLPSLARRESFGSSAAWIAWNARSGIRATKSR